MNHSFFSKLSCIVGPCVRIGHELLFCKDCFFCLWVYKATELTFIIWPLPPNAATDGWGYVYFKGRFTHSVPRPCRATKHLECLSQLIYTVRPCLIHICHAAPMPCSDHAVLLKAMAQHSGRETACGLPARVRLLPATTWSSTKIVIRSIPIFLTMIHTYDCKKW